MFTRTKHGANRLADQLEKDGIQCAAIHGNKSQNARTKALADFKDYKVQVLVATDIAARGLDITELPQVVNYELPHVPEDYVHRIGRTGRAGATGPGAVAGVDRREGPPARHRARARPQDQRAAARPLGNPLAGGASGAAAQAAAAQRAACGAARSRRSSAATARRRAATAAAVVAGGDASRRRSAAAPAQGFQSGSSKYFG